VKKVSHLEDIQIIEALIDESGLDRELRRHLFECPACRAQKEALEVGLARFGQISRGQAPANFRKPRFVEQGAGRFGLVWKIRPALGLGMVFATLLALLVSPLTIKRDKLYTQDVVYREMLQDEKFMTEIEKLEENPLPRFYVDIGDPGDDEGDPQSPGAKMAPPERPTRLIDPA
jgi:hypothetical protein